MKKFNCVLVGEEKQFIDSAGKPVNYVEYKIVINGETIRIKIDKYSKSVMRYIYNSTVKEG